MANAIPTSSSMTEEIEYEEFQKPQFFIKQGHLMKAQFPIWKASGDVMQKFVPFLRDGHFWHRPQTLFTSTNSIFKHCHPISVKIMGEGENVIVYVDRKKLGKLQPQSQNKETTQSIATSSSTIETQETSRLIANEGAAVLELNEHESSHLEENVDDLDQTIEAITFNVPSAELSSIVSFTSSNGETGDNPFSEVNIAEQTAREFMTKKAVVYLHDINNRNTCNGPGTSESNSFPAQRKSTTKERRSRATKSAKSCVSKSENSIVMTSHDITDELEERQDDNHVLPRNESNQSIAAEPISLQDQRDVSRNGRTLTEDLPIEAVQESSRRSRAVRLPSISEEESVVTIALNEAGGLGLLPSTSSEGGSEESSKTTSVRGNSSSLSSTAEIVDKRKLSKVKKLKAKSKYRTTGNDPISGIIGGAEHPQMQKKQNSSASRGVNKMKREGTRTTPRSRPQHRPQPLETVTSSSHINDEDDSETLVQEMITVDTSIDDVIVTRLVEGTIGGIPLSILRNEPPSELNQRNMIEIPQIESPDNSMIEIPGIPRYRGTPPQIESPDNSMIEIPGTPPQIESPNNSRENSAERSASEATEPVPVPVSRDADTANALGYTQPQDPRTAVPRRSSELLASTTNERPRGTRLTRGHVRGIMRIDNDRRRRNRTVTHVVSPVAAARGRGSGRGRVRGIMRIDNPRAPLQPQAAPRRGATGRGRGARVMQIDNSRRRNREDIPIASPPEERGRRIMVTSDQQRRFRRMGMYESVEELHLAQAMRQSLQENTTSNGTDTATVTANQRSQSRTSSQSHEDSPPGLLPAAADLQEPDQNDPPPPPVLANQMLTEEMPELEASAAPGIPVPDANVNNTPSMTERSSPPARLGLPVIQNSNVLKDVGKLVECPLCLDIYKDPKLLQCGHSFCKECIQGIYLDNHGVRGELAAKCPVCRHPTVVANEKGEWVNLMTDYKAADLVDILSHRTNATRSTCGSCGASGAYMCLNCQLWMCKRCKLRHSSRMNASNHVVLEAQATFLCQKHNKALCVYFCRQCSFPACSVCALEECADHDIVQYVDALNSIIASVESYGDDILSEVDDAFKKTQQSLDKVQEEIEAHFKESYRNAMKNVEKYRVASRQYAAWKGNKKKEAIKALRNLKKENMSSGVNGNTFGSLFDVLEGVESPMYAFKKDEDASFGEVVCTGSSTSITDWGTDSTE